MKTALVSFVLSIFAFFIFHSLVIFMNNKQREDIEMNEKMNWTFRPTFVMRHPWLCATICAFDILSLVAVAASIVGIILVLPIG